MVWPEMKPAWALHRQAQQSPNSSGRPNRLAATERSACARLLHADALQPGGAGHHRDLRCFWGTDLSRMIGAYGHGYREAIDHLMGLPFLDAEDKEWILGRGLCEWLRWPA